MKTQLTLIFFLILVNLTFISSQQINQLQYEPNLTSLHFQTSLICHQSDYLNNITNSSNALLHCFTYTILGTEETPESSGDFIYDEESNIYYLNKGFSLHYIFFNETYDIGFTNITYNEYIQAHDWIENNLELFYEASLTYDLNGNLIQDNTQYYEYNDFNQLVRVRNSNSTGSIIEEYFYDANGDRIFKNVVKSGTNETVYYIGDEFVHVINASGKFNTTFYYADGVLVAEKDQNNNKKFYHPDHLGSTSLITNSSGDIIEETFYLPYGETLSGGEESRYGYTSKEKDGTGLNYYGARYYKSTQSQFIQPDSNLPNVYNPQYLNRYSYVLNNPYKYVDPDGEVAILPLIIAAYIVWDYGDAVAYAEISIGYSILALNTGEKEYINKAKESFGSAASAAVPLQSLPKGWATLPKDTKEFNEDWSKVNSDKKNEKGKLRLVNEEEKNQENDEEGIIHLGRQDKISLPISNRISFDYNQYFSGYPGTGETQQPGPDGVIYAYEGGRSRQRFKSFPRKESSRDNCKNYEGC